MPFDCFSLLYLYIVYLIVVDRNWATEGSWSSYISLNHLLLSIHQITLFVSNSRISSYRIKLAPAKVRSWLHNSHFQGGGCNDSDTILRLIDVSIISTPTFLPLHFQFALLIWSFAFFTAVVVDRLIKIGLFWGTTPYLIKVRWAGRERVAVWRPCSRFPVNVQADVGKITCLLCSLLF